MFETLLLYYVYQLLSLEPIAKLSCSSRLAFATFKCTEGLLWLYPFPEQNKAYKTKPAKANLQNRTKPTKLNLQNQTYQIKPTKRNFQKIQYKTYYIKPSKPNLLYQTYQTESNPGKRKHALSLAQLSPSLF